ncbi:hypothetical protein F53441_7256 [Fusarium austroafricanum]|uniref:4'-phosphopantetheinyl transferase domain-containing protein n=1 Tax=Fusarium austroafricanum TaxID=2364996 RepID=A0A8H4KGR2_9HYPO|nr:hypothetical protein F53441_7256 [Fusarium austroafricanum]
MKPLRAFPLPLNIGTDICQISRIYRILFSPRATRFVNRVLTPEELAKKDARLNILDSVRAQQCKLQLNLHGGRKTLQTHDQLASNDPEMWKCAAFIAGRFAAKEAAIKAHPHRRLTFHEVIIERRPVDSERLGSGPPIARIRSGEGDSEDPSALVSISHDGDYATAVCLGHEPDGDS